jgi:hypothetical protein
MQTNCAICIGAPRSGTTWLYQNLRRHPDIFLPPVKEVRQFFACLSISDRNKIAKRILEDPASTANDITWTQKWLASDPRDEEAYRVLMRDVVPAPVVMDISPIYCIAPIEVIEQFKAALGDGVRIVFLMRNPVDRDFSQAKHERHMRTGETEPMPIQAYLDLLRTRVMQKRNRYLETIRRWRSVFGADAIHLEFYDSIVTEPQAVLKRITAHIGASSVPNLFAKTSKQRFGEGPAFNVVPQELKTALAEMHIGQIARLAKKFPNPCARWLEDAERRVSAYA